LNEEAGHSERGVADVDGPAAAGGIRPASNATPGAIRAAGPAVAGEVDGERGGRSGWETSF